MTVYQFIKSTVIYKMGVYNNNSHWFLNSAVSLMSLYYTVQMAQK